MEYFYSPLTKGLYSLDTHSEIPESAEKISAEQYMELISAAEQGLSISDSRPWRGVQIEMGTEYKERLARENRDNVISKTTWILDRHSGQLQISVETSISDHQYNELLLYHQALREWPAQPGWPDIDMPLPPDWLAELTA